MGKSNSQVSTLDDDQNEGASAAPAAKAADAVQVKGSNHDEQLSGERRTITIHATDGDGGSDAVFVSLNGFAYQIPRATPQSVPVEVIEILKNARSTLHQNTSAGVVQRQVPRFSFSID